MPSIPTTGAGPSAASDPLAGYLVYDTFTDADDVTPGNHTPEKDIVGTGWELGLFAGNASIQSNKLSDGSTQLHWLIDTGKANIIETATMLIQGNNFYGFSVRYQDNDNFFIIGCGIGANAYTCWKRDAAAWSQLGSGGSDPNAGDTVEGKVTTDDDDAITVFSDGGATQELTVTNSTFNTETHHGFYVDGTLAATGNYDNLTISENV